MTHKTKLPVLVGALRILVEDIQTDDGVANACIAEAALRLEELHVEVERLRKTLEDAAMQIPSEELSRERFDNADFVGAYDTFIHKAKNALNQ